MRIAGCADEQLQGAACRPGAEKGSENSASCDDRAQQFGFEIFRYEIGYGHRSPAQNSVHILLAEVAQGAAGLEYAPKIAAAWVIDIGWRGGQASAITLLIFASELLNSGYFVASFCEKAAIACAD